MTKNKMKAKLLLIAFVGIFGHGVVSAAETTTMSIKEMVEKTVLTNPEVQARYHRLLEAGFEQEVARGRFLPRADLNGRYLWQEDVSGNYSEQSRSGFANPRFNAEVVLSQMLFDGFATRSEVNRLDHNKKGAYYDLQNAMQTTALEFTTAYLDILRFRQLVDFAKQNYIAHKQIYTKIVDRSNAGIAKGVDLQQAEGRLALAEANLLVETTNLHDVTARMQRIYGELPPDNLEKPTFYNNGVESSVEEALKIAFAQNPDLLAKIEGIQASKDEVKLRKANYLPRFDVVGRKNVGHSDNGRFNGIAADSVELQMAFNLFNGFSDKNQILQSAQRLNTSADLRDKACIDTRQTVVIAYNDIQQLKEQLQYRLIHKNSVEKARVAYTDQFDLGARTLLDLLDTENELFQARRALTIAEYDLQTAYARTYAGQGELLKKLDASRSDLVEINRDDYLDAENVCKAAAPTQMVIDKTDIPVPMPVAVAAPKQALAPKPACSVEKITNTVKDWVSAAAQKNSGNYLYYYADNFDPSNGLSKSAWESQKRKEFGGKGKTEYSVSNIQASCDGDNGSAVFDLNSATTTYKLKKVSDTSCEVCNMKRIPIQGPQKSVNKKLDFTDVAGQWKITKETPL
jgi:adhesin transport system outer membrane protein